MSPLTAAPIAETKIRKAVEHWVRRVTAQRRADGVIERLEPYRENGETVAYIVHLVNGGYCLAGTDSMVLPVYWYSPKGTYDSTDPGLRAILEEIGDRVRYLRQEMAKGGANLKVHGKALAKRALQWEDFSADREASGETGDGGTGSEATSESLILPFKSQWHQGSPYNASCPTLGTSADRAIVGCVATAMAQVMHYWRWPNIGAGTSGDVIYNFYQTGEWYAANLENDPLIPADSDWTGRLSWSGGKLRMSGAWDNTLFKKAAAISIDTSYQDALSGAWSVLRYFTPESHTHMSANFGATTYQWDMVQDSHSDPVDNGDAEVAKLCFHAGLAVNMNYGVEASGASTSDIPDALADHFRYDPDAFVADTDIDRIVEEIRWQRPVLLDGCDGNGGCHEWVAFGYEKSDGLCQLWMHLGWGGEPGLKTLDEVGYIQHDSIVSQIAPLGVVKFVGSIWPLGDGSPDSPYFNIESAMASVSDGTTLIFKANSINTFSGSSLMVSRPLTLKGFNAVITKE